MNRATTARLARAPTRAWVRTSSPLVGVWVAGLLIGLLMACDVAGAISVRSHLQRESTQDRTFIAAVNALARSSSVRIRGATSIGPAPVRLDVVAGAGRGGGTVSIGPAVFSVVWAGSTLYLRASALTWQEVGFAAAAPHLADRWVRAPEDQEPFTTIGYFVNIQVFASLLESTPRLVNGRPTIFDDVRVIVLHAANRSGLTFYLSATGTPSLVAEAGSAGLLRFDQYGTARAPGPPACPVRSPADFVSGDRPAICSEQLRD